MGAFLHPRQTEIDIIFEITKLLAESFESANVLRKLNETVAEGFAGKCVIHRTTVGELPVAGESSVVTPLIARGRRLGAMEITLSGGRRFSDDDVKFIEQLARLAALAIDNERLYRDAQDSTQLKDEFLATISHELRTPLNAIAGWTAILRRQGTPPDVLQHALERIQRNVTLQTSLIDDLLDVSRIMGGKMQLSLGPADLVALISSTVKLMQGSAEAKSIELTCELKESRALTMCDAMRVQQIMWNLLSNAIKFTPLHGKIGVTVQQNGGDSLEILVTDNGAGIAPEFIPRIFDRFRQFDGSSTRTATGLGLGLSIVKTLVELHGGSISVRSAGLGQGSTFSVIFPITMKLASAAGE